ncbi:MAG: sigma-70 family RNA polymerase sigma factor [Planctomycetes bacterium]|nr:sigma-70 family RNA polymerase sigma factor [Planctomycetota bacterium]
MPAERPADLDEMVARYLPGLRAFVRLHMGPTLRSLEESCDLTQSVAREVLQHAERFRTGGEAGFREWLYTTARRKILHRVEHWQARKRSAPGGVGLEDVLETHAAVMATPSQHASARENLATVEAAFDRLTEEQREVVVQHKLIGSSHAEIAARMGKTPEAVRALLARAMARLALALDTPGTGGP